MEGKKLTKKQAKNFARIQSGLLIYNSPGSEFDESNISEKEESLCRSEMEKYHAKLLKSDEYGLGSTSAILEYVRKSF